MPEDVQYMPAGQGVKTEAVHVPPWGHAEHAELAVAPVAAEYVPGGHGVGMMVPAASQYVPAGHGICVADVPFGQ